MIIIYVAIECESYISFLKYHIHVLNLCTSGTNEKMFMEGFDRLSFSWVLELQ